MAQITIPEATRGGPGSSNVFSPGLTIPAGLQSIAITYSIPQATRNSTAVSLHQMIEVSTNNGQTWKAYMDGGIWKGGTGEVNRQGVLNPAPSMTLGGPALQALTGQLTRGHWEIPTAMTIGATVTAV